ncbi:hypothetical protein ACIBCT_35340 [Streptosporangium sp. NPDC050855]|uniref:hypothetical protein n=1 Tax=Streptosporangium sp. NPDC050855 TaxID=3366194 RepID=UPI0037A311B5
MRFSYINEDYMRERWPVGCRARLKSLPGNSTTLTIAPHAETNSPYNLRYSTRTKSGPAVNITYPKYWRNRKGGWVFAAALRLIGKCADGTCNHAERR